MNQLKFDFNRPQPLDITTKNEDDLVQWGFALSLFARLVAYVAILALLVIILFLILKCLADFDNYQTTEEEATASETNPLLQSAKTVPFTYGACERDLESGNCSSCSSSSSSNSSEELYDGKICVICYDEERNCFLVPCGHCATCYDCAQRIFKGENRTCPVCRRLIGKVRRLFAP
ncbi:E3 ubiquitin-protein ligase APD2-like [Mangifera indica]|uniref:E3 ubiquitin-protein ligase APD2-like n=1 Tax=Mangifera indica TaxID=29780 RepID=UPI001CFBC784|nr:E3 ubiquitin-protein ligase APD2-like [Mangifera indica]